MGAGDHDVEPNMTELAMCRESSIAGSCDRFIREPHDTICCLVGQYQYCSSFRTTIIVTSARLFSMELNILMDNLCCIHPPSRACSR